MGHDCVGDSCQDSVTHAMVTSRVVELLEIIDIQQQ
jgi:hypothetical protein